MIKITTTKKWRALVQRSIDKQSLLDIADSELRHMQGLYNASLLEIDRLKRDLAEALKIADGRRQENQNLLNGLRKAKTHNENLTNERNKLRDRIERMTCIDINKGAIKRVVTERKDGH